MPLVACWPTASSKAFYWLLLEQWPRSLQQNGRQYWGLGDFLVSMIRKKFLFFCSWNPVHTCNFWAGRCFCWVSKR